MCALSVQSTRIIIDSDRLNQELETLASFSDSPSPAVTRIVFSESDRRAREYVKGLCREAGLAIREDAVGNTFARWNGERPEEAAIATGSHIDAIPNAGRYDGTVGVLGGLEAIRALKRSGLSPKRPIELLVFTSEEPTRFGIGCLGSRLLSGNRDASVDEKLKDKVGQTLRETREAAGFSGDLQQVPVSRSYYHGFVELHIEQGPLLEQEQLDIGVVIAIAAPASLRVSVEGQGGHAGGVLMPDRHDALCAAAEIILSVESAAKSTGSRDTVATTGVCDVFPSAVNSIPSRVRLEVDLRDIDEQRRETVSRLIRQRCDEVAGHRSVSVQIETVNADAPGECAPEVVDAIESACRTNQLRFRRMVSRAYHDSLFMSRIAPTGMIFIPCKDGISHRPDEYASPVAIANGTRVLAHVLAELASK
ncbi:MAG TPA: M20 family metallo-hydrolase [Terriglobales bacterium]|jgi:ureidoglycolate amidohydrolase|nr:M20 family metallo-hydrolase [Terriglobales bacterium]